MEQYVTLAHSMEKEHFVSFAALISFDRVQEPAVRFAGGFFHAAVCCRIHWRGEGA